MGVIVELRIPSHQFEFGRRLPDRFGNPIELERVNTESEDSTPLFSFSGSPDGGVDDPLGDVGGCQVEFVDTLDGRGLYLLQWDPDADPFFRLLNDNGGRVRCGTGTEAGWTFETWFASHDDFATFRTVCDDAAPTVDVERVYSPTTTGTGAWFGLTPRQRRTLKLAVERGYYDIPRRCTTIELADELGISDQAVTERLRRGIVTFVTNALLLDEN